MNKYQEALNFLEEECRSIKKGEAKKYVNSLQELVSKATPKKPIYRKVLYKEDYFYFCPTCGVRVPLYHNGYDQFMYPFCPYCGQAIDWSEDEEDVD